MPRDTRLYMTFPNDFWLHPKIRPLSDAAFRTFVEINGYSRMQDLDGRVPIRSAKATWKPRALAELLANHPERPSLSVDGEDYVIWNYDQHQETRASRAERAATNRANGQKGGRPPKAKRYETDSVSESEPNQKQSQRSESEIEPDVTYLPESGPVGDGPIRRSDSILAARAKRVGISDLEATRTLLEHTAGSPVSLLGALELAKAICNRAKQPVLDVDAYVATACRNSPAEVQKAYFDLDIEGVA